MVFFRIFKVDFSAPLLKALAEILRIFSQPFTKLEK